MFREFSFDAASRQPPYFHEAERAAMNVSPTSIPRFAPPPCPPTPPPYSVGELAARLDQQSLRIYPGSACPFPSADEPLTPLSDHHAFPDEPMDRAPRPTYSRVSTAMLRMQRQSNIRLQCSSTHIKDISLLVQRMVEDEDQCHICDIKPTSPTSNTSSADEDEGVDMDYTPPSPPSPPLYTLKFRRSGDRLTGGAAVSKNVRMRKPSRDPRGTKQSSR